MDRDNRKSHLAPQLSPAIQDLLRSSDSPSYPAQNEGGVQQTPTSGEIPILGTMVSPRDQFDSVPTRPPPRSGSGSISLGRAGGANVHPGLGPRVASTNSVMQHRSRPSGSVAYEDQQPPRRTGSPSMAPPPQRTAPPPQRTASPSMAPPQRTASPSMAPPQRTSSPSTATKSTTMSLPMRPAPPSGPLPPAPRRQLTSEELRRENLRRAMGPGSSSGGRHY